MPAESDTPAPAPASKAPAQPPPSAPSPAPPQDHASAKKQKRPAVWIVLAVIVVLILIKGVPWVLEALATATTDDAYVNGHVTFTAPRVAGQVQRVLVDDNNRVHQGDLLVELDKAPYRILVDVKKAALDSANADLVAAKATVLGTIGQARSLRYKLLHAIEDVNSQVALLRARVAALEQSKATVKLTQAEFDRSKGLLSTNAVSREDFDQRQEALQVAQAQLNQAMENIYQSRVSLGLPPQPATGADLASVPPDLDQRFSSVRQAQAELIQAASVLGVTASSYDLTPQAMLEEFYKRDPEGNIDRIYASIAKDAPALKQAEAKRLVAQRDVEEAELNLSYCEIRAEIDGVVTRRNVNPGNNVQVGQSLMAIRSLREIWVDANFKETQLANLRIGQRAELEVDMYGRHKVFQGRVSGFTMGTGATLALLPAQNATGNYIKVVQRLPVRIELTDYDPDQETLFIGLSVEPRVYVKEPPTGPNAGKFLQPYSTPAPSAVPAAIKP